MRRQLKIGFALFLILPTLMALALSGCGSPTEMDEEDIAPRLTRVGDKLVFRGVGEVPLIKYPTLGEDQVKKYARKAMGSLQNNFGYFRDLGVSEGLLSPMEQHAQ